MKRAVLLIILVALLAGGGMVLLRSRRPAGALPPPPTIAAGTVSAPVSCFYPARTGLDLVEEIRQRPKPATAQERLQAVVEELHRPPASAAALPLFPAGSAPRAVFLSAEGMACVDEPLAALERDLGPRDEFLILRALAKSVLRACPEARTLVVLADGAPRPRFLLHLSGAGRFVLPRPATRTPAP